MSRTARSAGGRDERAALIAGPFLGELYLECDAPGVNINLADQKLFVDLVVPIRTRSMSNARLHWAAKARIVKGERKAVALLWPRGANVPLPCAVHLTRVSPRPLDDDNLRGALKAIRDQVAAQLGVDDRDPRVTWSYAQTRGKPKEYAVRIEVDLAPPF